MEINKSINNNNNNELRNFLSVEDKMFNEDFLMNKYFNILFFDDRDSKMLNDKILQLQKHVSLMNLSDIEITKLEKNFFSLIYKEFTNKTNEICLVSNSLSEESRSQLLMNLSRLVSELLEKKISTSLISKHIQHLINQLILVQDISIRSNNIYLNIDLIIFVLENTHYDSSYKVSIFNRLLKNIKYLKINDFLRFLAYLDERSSKNNNFSSIILLKPSLSEAI